MLGRLDSQGDHDESEHAQKGESERGAGRAEESSEDSDGGTRENHEDHGDGGEDLAGDGAGDLHRRVRFTGLNRWPRATSGCTP